jgi:sirohydrochlorin cobaltochelatase
MTHDKRAVLIVAHGSPARDTPMELRRELRRLHAKQDKSPDELEREREVELEIRRWPRTGDNDPYHRGTETLAKELSILLGDTPVVAAYNEFCTPDVDEAVANLVAQGVRRVEVLSTMVTPGGGHSERDIPGALEACRAKFPDVEFEYRWPYDLKLVAQLLAKHLRTKEG